MTKDIEPTAVDHGVTITEEPCAGSVLFAASCLCGWRSASIADRRRAVAAGEYHLEEVRPYSIVNAIEWDDEAGTVFVRRLPWMTDRQWRIVRDGMVAHFEAEGLIPAEAARSRC